MKNKVVIITGGSSGIGLSTAKHFINKGSIVIISGRNENKLRNVELEIDSENLYVFKSNVSIEKECKELVDFVIKKFDIIDVIINNAGISMRSSLLDVDLRVIKKVMDINFWGTVYMTKYCLPKIIENKGTIVGISSIAGKIGLPLRTGYSSSKFAMEGFLECLRTEMLKEDVFVTTICPGFTKSEIRKNSLVSDGSIQEESPRNENKMMSSEKVAEIIYTTVLKRKKNNVVLTAQGKLVVFLKKFFANIAMKRVFNVMKKEQNSNL